MSFAGNLPNAEREPATRSGHNMSPQEVMMQDVSEKKELRNFGLIVGGLFALIGVWPLIRHGEALRVWALVLAFLLIPLGLLWPTVLRPIFKVWMKIGHVMGWVNTRIILGILYFGLITPMGMVMRLFGWDSMRRTLMQDAETYRVVRQARPRNHLTRQF